MNTVNNISIENNFNGDGEYDESWVIKQIIEMGDRIKCETVRGFVK